MSRRFDAYKVSRNDNLAAPDFWNRRFEDIDLRITARENDIDAMDTLFSSIESLALSRMNDVFTPLIQQAQEALNSFGISFSAETLSSVLVGTGAKQVTLTEETRGGFYYAEYVALRSNDTLATMLAQVTDYTRETGVLELDVVSVVGTGTHAGWQIIVGSPPDETHASRTDNPHSVTAAQVGSYTTAQVDDAIATAIDALPEVADALRPTNNLSDLDNPQTARSNLGVLNSALNFSDVPNKATARGNLGLGSAAVEAASAFQPAGSYQAADPQLFAGVPQNSKSTNYTLVATDANKHIYHPSSDTSSRTWTIPSNASVPFPIGTVIEFVNGHNAGTITIAITSDTMRLAGAGTTGSRTLADDGMATAIKVTATEWKISGTGLT